MIASQAVDEDREVALAKLRAALGISESDRGETLEEQVNIQMGDVGAKRAGRVDAFEQLDAQRLHPLREGKLLSRG